MFSQCIKLKYLPDLSKWDTTNVEDMAYTFVKCPGLISLPDLSKWNMSKVTDISYIF